VLRRAKALAAAEQRLGVLNQVAGVVLLGKVGAAGGGDGQAARLCGGGEGVGSALGGLFWFV